MKFDNIKNALDNLSAENPNPEQINKIVNALTSNEVKEHIKKTQNNIDEANTIRIQSETKIASYRESYEDILNELKSMGVNPKNINLELLNLCKEITDIVVQLEDLTPNIEQIKQQMSAMNQSNSNGSIF